MQSARWCLGCLEPPRNHIVGVRTIRACQPQYQSQCNTWGERSPTDDESRVPMQAMTIAIPYSEDGMITYIEQEGGHKPVALRQFYDIIIYTGSTWCSTTTLLDRWTAMTARGGTRATAIDSSIIPSNSPSSIAHSKELGKRFSSQA